MSQTPDKVESNSKCGACNTDEKKLKKCETKDKVKWYFFFPLSYHRHNELEIPSAIKSYDH